MKKLVEEIKLNSELSAIELVDGLKYKLQHERGLRNLEVATLTRYLSTALEVARDMEDCFETRLIFEKLEQSLKLLRYDAA